MSEQQLLLTEIAIAEMTLSELMPQILI